MLKVKKLVQDNMAILRLSGELDFNTSSELRAALEETISDSVGALLINLNGLSLIDSSGIGMLLFAAKQMEQHKKKTILIAHRFVWELLNITKLTDFFEKAADEQEALSIAMQAG